MRRIGVLDFDASAHFVRRHGGKLETAQQICAKPLKMAADKPADLPGRLFVAERNLDVAKSKAAVFAKNEPGAKAERVSETKGDAQRQKADQDKTGAIN